MGKWSKFTHVLTRSSNASKLVDSVKLVEREKRGAVCVCVFVAKQTNCYDRSKAKVKVSIDHDWGGNDDGEDTTMPRKKKKSGGTQHDNSNYCRSTSSS